VTNYYKSWRTGRQTGIPCCEALTLEGCIVTTVEYLGPFYNFVVKDDKDEVVYERVVYEGYAE
jgi:hypothetical protein